MHPETLDETSTKTPNKSINLIILGERHSDPYAMSLSLALLQAAQGRDKFQKVIFAYEFPYDILENPNAARDPEETSKLKALNTSKDSEKAVLSIYVNKLSDELERCSDKKEEDTLMSKAELLLHVLDAEDVGYVELEKDDIGNQFGDLLEQKEQIPSSANNRHKHNRGIIAVNGKREEFMASRLCDFVEKQSEDSVLVVALLGCNHIKNFEHLVKEKIEGKKIDLSVINIPVMAAPDLRMESYRGKMNHSVEFPGRKYLDLEDVSYENGVIKLQQGRRGDLREFEGGCFEKINDMLGDDILKVTKRPKGKGIFGSVCGASSEYLEVYPVGRDVKESGQVEEEQETEENGDNVPGHKPVPMGISKVPSGEIMR